MEQFSVNKYLENPNRKVVTRDGRSARIICTNAKNNYPIVALIEMPNGRERQPCGYKKDGTYLIGEKLSCDLFFAPEKKTGWTNVYKYTFGGTHLGEIIYNSKEEAENNAKVYETDINTYITTIKIEWEE